MLWGCRSRCHAAPGCSGLRFAPAATRRRWPLRIPAPFGRERPACAACRSLELDRPWMREPRTLRSGGHAARLDTPGMRGSALCSRWPLVFRARLRPARVVAEPVPSPLAVPGHAPLSGLRQPPRRARTLPVWQGAAPALRFGTAPPRPPPFAWQVALPLVRGLLRQCLRWLPRQGGVRAGCGCMA